MDEIMDWDVVVVGSGAAGMVAAIRCHDLGLSPIVIEKTGLYGGTSAVSGGAIWIPNSPDVADRDSREQAMDYLAACTEGRVPTAKLERYVDVAPELLAYMRGLGIGYYSHPGLSYPDYYPDRPGALDYGRPMLVEPMEDGAVLGDEFFRLRESYPEFKFMGRISIDLPEGGALAGRAKGWMLLLARLMYRYYGDLRWRRRTRRDRRLTLGNALIGKLRKAMLDRGIPLLLDTGLTSIDQEGGLVTGVTALRNGRSLTINARRGVVLASGGFEHDQTLRDTHLGPGTQVAWSATPAGINTGEGLGAARAVGADVEFMDEAWWAPTMTVPDREAGKPPRAIALFWERGFPHSLAVNRLGRRFTNEIVSYHQFGQAMLRDNAATCANLPCWMIFDATYRRNYPLGPLLPGNAVPDGRLPGDWLDQVLIRADTIAELASRIDVPVEELERTVARFNGFAESGVDADFARGDDVYSKAFGDPGHGPNRVLGVVAVAPYYAVRLDLGDLGTKGGAKTNEDAMVLGEGGRPIPRLFAVGNVAGSVMGGAYPGAGATLGAAMVFAYVAAARLAQLNRPA